MAWGDIPGIIKQVLSRFWGYQTREQASVQTEAEQAQRDFDQALVRGDLPAANDAIERLRALRDKATAVRPKAE